MNFKTTLALVVLALIVALAMWWLPAHAPAPVAPTAEAAGPAKPTALFDPAPVADDIVRIELARADAAPIIIERDAVADAARASAAPWHLLEPVAAPAEGYLARQVVTPLTTLASRAQFEPGEAGQPTAAETGLEPPAVTLTLIDAAGTRFALEIGKRVVMSNDTYVRKVGQPTIYVADRDLLTLTRKTANDFRSKRLLEFKPENAVSVQIKQADTTYALARDGDQTWEIKEPVGAYADAVKVGDLIRKISAVRADEFIDDAPTTLAAYGLDQPELSFTVTTETRTELPRPEGPTTEPTEPQYETVTATHALLVGRSDLKGEKRYVKLADQPWVANVLDANIAGLLPVLGELRDARVTHLKTAEVQRIELTAGGVKVTVDKADDKWTSTGDLSELDTPAIMALLVALEDLRAVDYVEGVDTSNPAVLAEYGLDEPRAVLTVTMRGAAPPFALRVGKTTGSGRNAYVQRNAEPTVIVVSAAQADLLAVDALALRSREIFTFPLEQMQTLSVQRPAMHYQLARLDGEWQLTDPPGAPVNADTVRVLTTDLSRLRAKRVIGKGNAADFGLAAPLMTLQFDVAQTPPSAEPAGAESTENAPPATQTQTHTLYVSRQANVAYARCDDNPYVFELDDSVYQVLIAELIDPRVMSFAADDVVGVEIVSTGGTLDFAKAGTRWEFAPDPYLELSQKKLTEFVQELADLRAEAYYAYRGGDLADEQLLDTPARVTIRLADGSEIVLHMTQERPGQLPLKAALVAEGCIFRMRPVDCEKLMRGLDQYIKPPEPTTPTAP